MKKTASKLRLLFFIPVLLIGMNGFGQTWQTVFNGEVASPTWTFTGIETDGTNIYCGSWNLGGFINKYDTSGAFLGSFTLSNWPGGISGIFSMTNDGTFFYAVGNTGNIIKINMAAQSVVGTISTSLGGLNFIGYDPLANSGAGGFWTGGLNNISLVSMNGTTISNLPASSVTPFISSITGCAYDPYTVAGTPMLWFMAQDGANLVTLHQFNRTTQSFTGVTHDCSNIPGVMTGGQSLAGSIAATSSLVSCKFMLLAIVQGSTTSPTNSPFAGIELKSFSTADVGITALLSPVSSPNLGANQQITVTIHNFATAPVTGFPVQYIFQGGTAVVATYNGPAIAAGASVNFTFTGGVDMSVYCSYTLQVCTAIPCDINPGNDCLNLMVTHSLPIVYDTLYPQNIANWTGTTDGNSFTQNSLIRISGGNLQNGWAKFDINSFPINKNIVSAKLRIHSTTPYNDPRFRMTRMLTDPLTQTPLQVFNMVKGGASYGAYTNASSAGNWLEIPFSQQAVNDFQSQLIPGWFAVGLHEYESDTSKKAAFDGQAQGANKPCLAIQYFSPLSHDMGIYSLNLPAYILANQPYSPQITVQNFGSNIETNVVVNLTGPGGYNQSSTIASIQPGVKLPVTFPPIILAGGTACFTACTSYPTDINCNNDCLTACTVVVNGTTAYAYISNSPAYPEGPVSFVLGYPNLVTSLAPTSSPTPVRTSASVNGIWYAAEYYDPATADNHGHLYRVNYTTGAMTDLGFIGVGLTGITYDHTTGILYGLECKQVNIGEIRSRIYSINQANGAATLVHDFAYDLGKQVSLACNDAGMLFVFDKWSSRLCAIDPDTWNKEFFTGLNIPGSGLYESDFDINHNILYMVENTPNGELYNWNYLTGAVSHVGTFAGNGIITGMTIPFLYSQGNTDMGVMWISAPASGNLSAFEPFIVKVRNYGLTNVNSYSVCLSPTYCEPGMPLTPGASYYHAFTPTFNLSNPGIYPFEAFISNCAGDLNKLNDTTAKIVTNSACGQIACYPYAIQEPETCGQDTNGGCLSSPAAFTSISLGQSYCGTVWKIDTLRDTDWYQFILNSTQTIRVMSKSEFDLDFILVKLPCSLDSVLLHRFIYACHPDTLIYDNLPAGTYALVYAPSYSNYNFACPPLGSAPKYSFNFNLNGAILTTTLPNLAPCAGTVNIPVGVINMPNINGLNLSLTLPAGLSYQSYANLNPALLPSNLSVITSGDTVKIIYFSTTTVPAILQGTLVELVVAAIPGNYNVSWNGSIPGTGYTSLTTGFMVTSYIDGNINVTGCGQIKGFVNYDNLPSTPLYDSTNATLTPVNPAGAMLSQPLNSLGHFQFDALAPGTYLLSGQSTKTWGGANAVDALKILQHFVGQATLSGIRLQAADVNASGTVNAADALKVLQRFVGQISSFQAGDWAVEDKTINVSGVNSITQNLKALCFGDVNGSYVPYAKSGARMKLKFQDKIEAIPGQSIDLPVYYSNTGSYFSSNGVKENIAAMSLVINIPSGYRVMNLIPANGLAGDYFVYRITDHQMRIAWCDVRGVDLADGDPLFRIRLQIGKACDDNWSLGIGSSMADQDGMAVGNAGVRMPGITIVPGAFSLGQNQPNPFGNSTSIQYDIPVNCRLTLKVFNSLGKLVNILVDQEQLAGSYSVAFESGPAGAGVYYYRLDAKSAGKTFTATKMMVVTR